MNNGGRTNRPINFNRPVSGALQAARVLHNDLKFGDRVSMLQLQPFVQRFPAFRLIMIQLVRPDLCASFVMTHTGDEFDPERPVDKNTCILIHYKDHWSCCTRINALLEKAKNGGSYKFCHDCLRVVQIRQDGPQWPCHEQEVSRPKVKKVLPCPIDLCMGRIHTPTDPCPNRTCKTCNMGFPKLKPHRCLVMPDNLGQEHPHNKFVLFNTRYWNETEKRYDFCTDADGDGTTAAYFAYDFETMQVTEDISQGAVENLPHPDPTDNYGINLDEFDAIQRAYAEDIITKSPDLSAHNLTGKITRFEVNMVIVSNIFTGSVPKKPGDEPYRPSYKVFKGANCVYDFIVYLMGYNKGRCYAYAHNGAGFDSKFIFETVLKMDHLKQSFILRGSNFMSLNISPDAGHAKKTHFLDSMHHLPGSLSDLLDGFFGKSPDPNLRIRKGYFPHKFNTSENQEYVGPLPDISYYGIENIKLGSGAKKFASGLELQRWHEEESKNGPWDFQKELEKYCLQDVVGLAALLVVYMETSIPKGGIPLNRVTAPSFVHQLILQRSVKDLGLPETELRPIKKSLTQQNPTWDKATINKASYELRAKNSQDYVKRIEEHGKTGWVRLAPTEYNFVRRALRGGRTETRSSYMELTDEEMAQGIRIKYQDVVSLYPSEQMTREFPVGAPTIHFYDLRHRPCYYHQNKLNDDGEFMLECDCPILSYRNPAGELVLGRGYEGQFLALKNCTRSTPPTAHQFINDPDMFGYVCCDLTPPRNLYHPVIQIKKVIRDEFGKKIGSKCQNNLLPEDHLKLYLDTPTLKKALQNGYVLDRVYRFDQYKKGKPAWLEAAMEFYVDKERTSGDAPSLTEVGGKWSTVYQHRFNRPANSERQAYVDLFNSVCPTLGDRLCESMEDPTQSWYHDPAQRRVFKIYNNCGWGKHAQRPVMPKSKLLNMATDFEDMRAIFENLTNDIEELRGCSVFMDGKKIMFNTLHRNSTPNHHTTYLPAGAMVVLTNL